MNKKTGEITVSTNIKEKTFTKHIRVAGKNTPENNLFALYSLDNDSGKEFGLPSALGAPTIHIMGTHIKVFNEKLLGYYLYHLGALVKSGSFSENNIGEWFLNLAVAINVDVYKHRHMFGKLKINEVAEQEQLGLDFGSSMLCTASDGTEYSSGNVYQEFEDKIKLAQQRGDVDQVKRLHLKVRNKREDNINKIGLDIARKAQYIKAGDLSVEVLVKRKTIKLSPKQAKKHKSERRKKAGVDKKTPKEEFLKQQILKNKNNNKNSLSKTQTKNGNSLESVNVVEVNSNSNDTKSNTTKRKGFGKNLLDQGVGKLKQRLVGICPCCKCVVTAYAVT